MSDDKQRSQPKRDAPKPARFLETPDDKEGKAKKPKTDKCGKKQAITQGEKRMKRGAKPPKPAKKAVRVQKSAVLVKKRRHDSDRNLDAAWHERIARQNSQAKLYALQTGNGRKKPKSARRIEYPVSAETRPTLAVSEVPAGEKIGENLLTAIHMHVNYYYAGPGRVMMVPKKFRVSSEKPAAKETVPQQSAQGTQPPLPRLPQAMTQPQKETAGIPRIQQTTVAAEASGEDATYEATVAKIPDYIRQSQNQADQLMFALKLLFTREEIARCALTDKKSKCPSFEQEFGPLRIGIFYRVANSIFGVPSSKIATLICKRINYIRNSAKILRLAKDKRVLANAQKVADKDESELEEDGSRGTTGNDTDEDVVPESQSGEMPVDMDSDQYEGSESDDGNYDGDTEDEDNFEYRSPDEMTSDSEEMSETDDSEDAMPERTDRRRHRVAKN